MEAAGYPVTERMPRIGCASTCERPALCILRGAGRGRLSRDARRVRGAGEPRDRQGRCHRHPTGRFRRARPPHGARGLPGQRAAETPAAQTGPRGIQDETAPYRRAFVIAALLTLPVFVAEMGGHLLPAFHHWLHLTVGQTPLRVAQFLLTTLVLLGPGAVFFRLGMPAPASGARHEQPRGPWDRGRLGLVDPCHLRAICRPRGRPPCLFRGRRRDRDAHPAGPLAGGSGARPGRAAIAGLIALRPDTAPRLDMHRHAAGRGAGRDHDRRHPCCCGRAPGWRSTALSKPARAMWTRPC
jgi:hypothetical protein